MWRDIGLDEWLFDFDQADETAQVAAAAETATALVHERFRQSVAVVMREASRFVGEGS